MTDRSHLLSCLYQLLISPYDYFPTFEPGRKFYSALLHKVVLRIISLTRKAEISGTGGTRFSSGGIRFHLFFRRCFHLLEMYTPLLYLFTQLLGVSQTATLLAISKSFGQLTYSKDLDNGSVAESKQCLIAKILLIPGCSAAYPRVCISALWKQMAPSSLKL